MKFTKMHGCGNDYIYINCFEETVDDPESLAVRLSERHFGVGADGLILIAPSDVADCRMIMYNADGSDGVMCGNGIRCVAKYFYDHGMTDKTSVSVETGAGIKQLDLTVEEGRVSLVKVNMGSPILSPKDIPARFKGDRVVDEPIFVGGKMYHVTCVSVGNPHAIVFVDNVKDMDLTGIGPLFENHEFFPARINTEFVEILSPSEVNMRVWERGTGETLACGTGATACVVACVLNGYTEEHVLVHLLGGDLEIFYDRENDTVWMTGPAAVSFEGEIHD